MNVQKWIRLSNLVFPCAIFLIGTTVLFAGLFGWAYTQLYENTNKLYVDASGYGICNNNSISVVKVWEWTQYPADPLIFTSSISENNFKGLEKYKGRNSIVWMADKEPTVFDIIDVESGTITTSVSNLKNGTCHFTLDSIFLSVENAVEAVSSDKRQAWTTSKTCYNELICTEFDTLYQYSQALTIDVINFRFEDTTWWQSSVITTGTLWALKHMRMSKGTRVDTVAYGTVYFWQTDSIDDLMWDLILKFDLEKEDLNKTMSDIVSTSQTSNVSCLKNNIYTEYTQPTGFCWKKFCKDHYKNAITNHLGLLLYIYLNWNTAQQIDFIINNLLTSDNLFNDMTFNPQKKTCVHAEEWSTKYTYNHGPILLALAKAGQSDLAMLVGRAAMIYFQKNGILFEKDNGEWDHNTPLFKGIFVQYLTETAIYLQNETFLQEVKKFITDSYNRAKDNMVVGPDGSYYGPYIGEKPLMFSTKPNDYSKDASIQSLYSGIMLHVAFELLNA